MEVLSLQFVSPRVLNELGMAQMIDSSNWTLEETGEGLELDTGDWMIRSGDTQAVIDRWEVNQTTHEMRIKSGTDTDGFEPLDYTFAVSMIGQVGNKKNLQDYLDSLQRIFLTPKTEEPETPSDESSTENIEENE